HPVARVSNRSGGGGRSCRGCGDRKGGKDAEAHAVSVDRTTHDRITLSRLLCPTARSRGAQWMAATRTATRLLACSAFASLLLGGSTSAIGAPNRSTSGWD